MEEPLHFETLIHPEQEIQAVIEGRLHEYNLSVLGPEVVYDYARLGVVACDQAGQIQGGLLGSFVWGALKIDVLWVAEDSREIGTGTRLICLAEDAARERGLSLIFLETTSFQAREFYAKNGYEVYGRLEDYPKGHTWYHMKKKI